MAFHIQLDDTVVHWACRAQQTVLDAMRAAGVSRLPVGCRSGGCGVCRVQVLQGAFQVGQMSAAHIGPEERQAGIVLACQLQPLSDLTLRRLTPASSVPACLVVSS